MNAVSDNALQSFEGSENLAGIGDGKTSVVRGCIPLPPCFVCWRWAKKPSHRSPAPHEFSQASGNLLRRLSKHKATEKQRYLVYKLVKPHHTLCRRAFLFLAAHVVARIRKVATHCGAGMIASDDARLPAIWLHGTGRKPVTA